MATYEGLVLLALGLSVCAGCEYWDNRSLAEKPVPTVKPLKVNVLTLLKDEQVVSTTSYFGKLVAKRTTRLSIPKAGRLEEVFVDVGSRVGKGQLIAKLDQSELETRKSNLEQQLKDAQKKDLNEVSLQAAPSSGQVLQLEAEIQRLDAELDQGKLKAPYDCIVSKKLSEAGSLANPQATIVEIVEDDVPIVEASLPSKIAQALAMEQKVVWVLVGGQAVEAKVISRSPIESPIGSQTIKLSIVSELDDTRWSFGQTVEIRFFIETDYSGYWVPFSALSRASNGLWSAFVVGRKDAESVSLDGDEQFPIERRTLDIVHLEDNWVLAQGALEDGDWVVANGTHRIVTGQQVRVAIVDDELNPPHSSGAHQ